MADNTNGNQGHNRPRQDAERVQKSGQGGLQQDQKVSQGQQTDRQQSPGRSGQDLGQKSPGRDPSQR